MRLFSSVLTMVFFSTLAHAEIAVSANDGKQMRPGDEITAPEPDSVSVLNISGGRVKLLGSIAVPAAMIGPPAAVAVSKDSRFAIVTADQQLKDGKLIPNDAVSVIDLSTPASPRVVQTLHAGMGAMGVSISPNGKLAIVAGSDSSTVTLFGISGHALTQLDQLQLPEKTDPTDAIFSPDGRTAIVVSRAKSRLILLDVKNGKLSDTGKSFSPGLQPYGAVATHDGRYVINTNLGGALPAEGAANVQRVRGAPRIGTISMVRLGDGNIVASVPVGPTPEHVAMSPDGRFIAVVVANGTASVRSDPKWSSKLGLLKLFAVGDGTLTPAGQADTGHWCQGVTFSKDDGTLLLQCAGEREIEVFRFKDRELSRETDANIPMGARPGSIATAFSR
jgi:6-phosphogluconolactonase (cycloisomerase 2 family)